MPFRLAAKKIYPEIHTLLSFRFVCVTRFQLDGPFVYLIQHLQPQFLGQRVQFGDRLRSQLVTVDAAFQQRRLLTIQVVGCRAQVIMQVLADVIRLLVEIAFLDQRLGIQARKYLLDVLPKLGETTTSQVKHMTPQAWLRSQQQTTA